MSNIPLAHMNPGDNGHRSVSPLEMNRPPPPITTCDNPSGHVVPSGPPPMVRINPLLSPTFLSSPGEKGLPMPHNIFFHGSDVRPPRNRKPNYSENEKQIFFALITPHVDILDAKSQERQIMNMKTEIWKDITLKYNEIITKLSGNYVCRDSEELKTFWKNVRRSNRRKSIAEGGGHVPDLSERMGMEGPQTPTKADGSSNYLTCSPLLSGMPGLSEEVSSEPGPSSGPHEPMETGGEGIQQEYEREDPVDIKAEPIFHVEPEICEDENSQNNTQSSSDRRSSQSSPTPGMTGPYLLKKETHCTTILDQLLRDDTFCDVTLTAEGQSIRAHKIVLCLASAYFRQVLSKDSTVQNVIVFRDIKFTELKNLINFIYTGEATVDAAELESFMKTAEMLEVTSLCDGQRNLPKNFLSKNKETDAEKTKSAFPVKRSNTSNSCSASPPTKSRKIRDASPKCHKSLSYPSTSSGAVPVPPISVPAPQVIKSEPHSEDSAIEEEVYESKDIHSEYYEGGVKSPIQTQDTEKSPYFDNERTTDLSLPLEKSPPGRCPYCPGPQQQIRQGIALSKHLSTCHPDKISYCCEICSRVFLKKGSFEAHKEECNR